MTLSHRSRERRGGNPSRRVNRPSLPSYDSGGAFSPLPDKVLPWGAAVRRFGVLRPGRSAVAMVDSTPGDGELVPDQIRWVLALVRDLWLAWAAPVRIQVEG